MRHEIAVLVGLAVAAGDKPVAAGNRPDRDPGAEVRGVFAARCAGCHGPDLARPKGRFGYVLDLRRVAASPELVVPGRPDESELWALIRHGDMPPADSPYGPLSEAEKETVRTWIVAGAPDRLPAAPEAPPAVAPRAGRWVQWLGRFHLLLLHFPIALVVAAAGGEFVAAFRGIREPTPAVRFCLAVAALAVVPTVVFGWFHASSGDGGGSPLLGAHRLLGMAAGTWVVGTALWYQRVEPGGPWGRGARYALIVGALALVVATAHVGGLMVHGRDFFNL